jgi:alcohol dehydrogenase YqhD (iron-dependent ADH family)
LEARITGEIAEAVMRTVIASGRTAYAEPENYAARADVMWCSTLALQGVAALGKRFDGFNHGLEHVISGLTDITHADGLSIIAPHWMRHVLNENTAARFAGFARKVWGVEESDDIKAAEEGISRMSAYYQEIGMPLKLSDVGIGKDLVDEIVTRATPGGTMGNVIPLSADDVKAIVMDML